MDATPALTRRRLLQSGLAAAATVSFGPGFWSNALAAAPPAPGNGPYGPLLAADANGIQLPAGFTSRVVAQSGQAVPGTAYVFPAAPDGQAAFAMPDGGWVLATNAELPGGAGGVTAIRFNASGQTVAAYPILTGTSVNCAGGPTPWGTWLSCEEVARGRVWECDPTGVKPFVAHPAMGVFQHEAACVDAENHHVYLSEDMGDGCLYRFTPTVYPDLSSGLLEVACAGAGSGVVWKTVPDPQFLGATDLRLQVPDAIKFKRGEGIWFDSGLVYLVTTTDETIHVYDTKTATLSVLYRGADVSGTPLSGIDNIHVSRSGDVYVAEDSYTGDLDSMDICLISPEGQIARFLKLTGAGHFMPGGQSETVGITFDPSGKRMYLGSQRYLGAGIVYEISGPFRLQRPTTAPPPAPPLPPAPAPGIPIGIDAARRISIKSLIAKGLALGITLDQQASVRVRLTARVTSKGKRKTVTLFSTTRRLGRGRAMLRVKPTKAQAKLLRARKQPLPATLEVRITTPGAPVRTFKRTVSLRPT